MNINNMDGEITTLSKASTRSESLRTTVPAGIVRQFKFKEGDRLEWEIKPKNRRLIIVVTPVSTGKKREGV